MRTPKPKPHCVTLPAWLKANLGKPALAPLTGTDARCLAAAVMIVEAYAYDPCPELARAYGLCVQRMQRSTRDLAFHAIAHVHDWSDRARVWKAAGLEPIAVGKCAYEPGGGLE